MFIFFTFPFTKHVIAWTNVFTSKILVSTSARPWQEFVLIQPFYHSLNFYKYNSSWMVFLLLTLFVHRLDNFHYPSSIGLTIHYSSLGKLPAFTHPKIGLWLFKFLYEFWIFLRARFFLVHWLGKYILGFSSSIDWMNAP